MVVVVVGMVMVIVTVGHAPQPVVVIRRLG
jgi:hypothetical protein